MSGFLTRLFLLVCLCAGNSLLGWPPAQFAHAADPQLAPSGAAPAPGTVVVNPGNIQYYTKQGDTLALIARQFTAKADNWVQLARINRVSQDTSLPIGTAILIPADMLGDEPSEGKVVAMAGQVTFTQANGEPMIAEIGAKLSEGTQIETGNAGFLSIALPDGSRLTLPSNSRLKLAKLRMARFTHSPRTELLLIHGHVESRVAPLNTNQGKFEVRTPVSVAGVRGTHFRVGYEDGKATTEVLNGEVVVNPVRGKGEVALPGGKGNVSDAIKLGLPVDLLSAPTFESVQSVDAQGGRDIAMSVVPGAVAYHVQIARDPDAIAVVAEIRTDKLPARVRIPNGEYFVLLSAIDKWGLEGRVSMSAASFRSDRAAPAGNPAAAPYIDSADDKWLNLRWSKREGVHIKVQVARDAEFSWLVFSTEATGQAARLPRLPFGTYYARIQPILGDGSMAPFSAVQTFIVTDHWVLNEGGSAPVQQVSLPH